MLAVLRRGLPAVANFLLPQDCFVCGDECGPDPLCVACRAMLPRQPAGCPVCAVPTTEGVTCGRCLRDPPAFDATHAAFAYAFPLDRIVQALKYRHRLALAGFLADGLLPFVPSEKAVLLPMPLHVRRLRERGFNQAVEVARPLARATGLPLELGAVGRVLNTAPQASLPWKARRVNMRGAFRCDAVFTGKTVIVVDDVMTTGATLDELARTLKRHGAARVENLVVARTPSPA
ncbi:ComF family protein [Aromatoleum sp.]|uniref:ComF family protein n=1 Tax=Aromatoleum sp. TaxID=2307007 RepID=UPI002FC6727D